MSRALALAATLVLLGSLQTGQGWVPAWWLVNAVAALLWAVDKLAAVGGRARVPEAVLHGASLVGGCGACLARQLCRHKTLKPSFGLSCGLGLVASAALVGLS